MLRIYARIGQRVFDFMEEQPILVGVLSLLIGIALSVYFFGYAYPTRSALFGPEGQETPGTIEEMYATPSQSNVAYSADVAFQDANGQSHTIRDTYSMAKWYALKEDRNATVRYMKQDPSRAVETHSKEGERPSLVWYLLISGAFLILGLALIVYGRSLSHQEAEADQVPLPSYTTNPRPPGRPLG